jgi:hypothetical protein
LVGKVAIELEVSLRGTRAEIEKGRARHIGGKPPLNPSLKVATAPTARGLVDEPPCGRFGMEHERGGDGAMLEVGAGARGSIRELKRPVPLDVALVDFPIARAATVAAGGDREQARE